MKFLNLKNFFLKSSLSIFALAPMGIIVSCSNNTTNYWASNSSNNLYSNIWNLSGLNEIKNSIFDMTVSQLELRINEELKKDKTNDLLMKIYCFYLLWEAMINPKNESGSTQSNLSDEISSYSTFLKEKLVADDKNAKDENKKFNNFKSYIEKFDYKISILNFHNNSLSPDVTIREIIYDKSYYVMNFKIDFTINDEDTNSKMISNKTNKSIMYKNTLTRSQREELRLISNPEFKELATLQYWYQSTKLYYDINSKKFSTIVLPSNVNANGNEETLNSGYSSNDKNRKLLIFDFFRTNESSNNFESSINIMLSSTNNFNTSLTSDWFLFLEKEELYTEKDGNKKIKDIVINLNKQFYFDNSLYVE